VVGAGYSVSEEAGDLAAPTVAARARSPRGDS